jgi:hypothetical protein
VSSLAQEFWNAKFILIFNDQYVMCIRNSKFQISNFKRGAKDQGSIFNIQIMEYAIINMQYAMKSGGRVLA